MSDKRIETINPSTGKVISTYDIMSNDEIHKKVENAHVAQKNWKVSDILKMYGTYIRALGRVMRK